MESFENRNLPVPADHTLEGDARYFNSKFPAVGNWVKVEIRAAEFEILDSNTIDLRTDRHEVVVKIVNNAPNAPSMDDEIFVCYYTLGDVKKRNRAESLLNDIYKIYKGSK